MEVVQAIEDARAKERKPWPRHTNYMSDIGHGCERFLTYARTHWEERAPFSARSLMAFADGNMHEEAVLASLRLAGFKVLEEQSRLVDDYLKLSGKLDCRIVDKSGDSYLVEVKSMSPWIWAKIETIEDMIWSKHSWIRHYPAQMQAYLHYDREKNKKESKGMFLLKNKATGELKQIDVEYDENYALELMLKAERINHAVDKVIDVQGHRNEEHLPDRIDISEGLCDRCDFQLVCLPDQIIGEQAEVLHDAELLEMMQEREKLLPSSKEFDKLDKIVKRALKGRETVLIGEFVSHSHLVERKAYQVKANSYWKTEIKIQATPAEARPTT